MTPPVIRRWIDIVENGRTDQLAAVLADDAVFFSPAVFTPQQGRTKTAAYLKAAAKLFAGTDFHYVDQIHWNDDEQIVSFKVMLRPFQALQTVIPAMSALLQQS